MITYAAVTLLALSAAAPSSRARTTTGAASKPVSAPPASKAEKTPATSLPMPPPPVLKQPAAPAPEAAEKKKEVASERKGGLPPITLGAMLGPAFPLSNTVSAPGAGNSVWGRVVAHGTLPFQQLGPANLSFGVALGLQQFSLPGTTGVTSFGFDLLPSGRATFHLLDKLSAYGELGLGLVLYRTTAQVPFIGYQSAGASGLGVRLGGGLSYALSDTLSLILEPVGLLVANMTTSVTFQGQTLTASATGTQLSISFGATYRL